MEKMDMTNPEGVIRYTPSFQEELTGVRLIGMIHTTGLRAIIETVILLVAAGLFLSSYIREQDGNALFFALVCLVLIVVVWLVPELAMRRMAREKQGRTICIRLAPEGIFRILSDGESRAFLYDGLVAEQKNGVWLLQDGKNHRLVLPLRAIPEEKRKEVEDRLLSIADQKEK
ncbi:MAG: hypothetical protein ACLUUJ_04220 [Acutalibacteraceae bacterium]|nr:hypothetical protein [Bacillota bacterium]